MGSRAQHSPACYCDRPREFGGVELQCGTCAKWFHTECLSIYATGFLPYSTNYLFHCRACSTSDAETLARKQANFVQVCHTTIANLLLKEKSNDMLFSRDTDILPFIEANWDMLCAAPKKANKTQWHDQVKKALFREDTIFTYKEETSGDPFFGLVVQDLFAIRPLVELPPVDVAVKGKTSKRKVPADSKPKKIELIGVTKLSVHGYPLDYPMNKDGYKYILAEPDDNCPYRRAWDDSEAACGKAIPGWLYRVCVTPSVLLSLNDRAPELKIDDTRLSVTGDRGYSMVRSTHGVSYGSWYFEVKIVDMPENSATRIGFVQPMGYLQAPCGYDKYSYAWRSRKGTIFHEAKGKRYSGSYGKGDVLGFHLYLPIPTYAASSNLPINCKDLPLVKFKNNLYYEEKEVQLKLSPSIGSKVTFYKNGESQGVAFSDISTGHYFAGVSVYKSCTVAANFGPKFDCKPNGLKDFRPFSEAAGENCVMQSVQDLLYYIDHEEHPPEL